MAKRTSSREKLLGELRRLVPTVVSGGILFHQAVADQVGLHLTDLKCLQLLQAGPQSAGQMLERTGITSGAMTRLIDRLERAGYVHRCDDPTDRRRVIVEAVPAALEKLARLYSGMASGWEHLLAGYDDTELALVLDLFTRMNALTSREIERLSALHNLV